MAQGNFLYPILHLDDYGDTITPLINQCNGHEVWNLLTDSPIKTGEYYLLFRFKPEVSQKTVIRAVCDYRGKEFSSVPNIVMKHEGNFTVLLSGSVELDSDAVSGLIEDYLIST